MAKTVAEFKEAFPREAATSASSAALAPPPPVPPSPQDNPDKASKLMEEVRNLKMNAQRDNLVLNGTLDERTKAIDDMGSRDQYQSAEAAITKLSIELEEEKRLLAMEKENYGTREKALKDLDLKNVLSSAPQGLETTFGVTAAGQLKFLFNRIAGAQNGVLENPKFLGDYQRANKALDVLKLKVTQFLVVKKNIENGVAKFSSTGSKLAELASNLG